MWYVEMFHTEGKKKHVADKIADKINIFFKNVDKTVQLQLLKKMMLKWAELHLRQEK